MSAERLHGDLSPSREDGRSPIGMVGRHIDRIVEGGLAERVRRRAMVSMLGFPPDALPASPAQYRGREAAEYDGRRARRAIFQWEQGVVARLLEPEPPGSHVLDIPVGTGRFIPTYVGLGLEVTGFDSSADMLEQARRVIRAGEPVSLVQGSATRLPFPDDSFDILVSFRFLPGKLSLRQARRALREYARVTRGEMHLLLKVGERTLAPSWRDEYSRLGARPEHELRAILAEAGLRIERITRAPDGPKAVITCRRSVGSGPVSA